MCLTCSGVSSRILSGWYKERFKSHTMTGKQREEVVWRNYEMYQQQSIFDMIGEEEP